MRTKIAKEALKKEIEEAKIPAAVDASTTSSKKEHYRPIDGKKKDGSWDLRTTIGKLGAAAELNNSGASALSANKPSAAFKISGQSSMTSSGSHYRPTEHGNLRLDG